MPTYLIITDRGIVTRPVVANTPADLAAALAAEVADGKAAAIELTTLADIADGSVPQALLDGQTNAAALKAKAQAALATNAAYLSIANPTAAQVAAQAKALTRECNALIRLALNLVDTTSGT